MQAGRQALADHLAKVKDAGWVDDVRLFTVSELVQPIRRETQSQWPKSPESYAAVA